MNFVRRYGVALVFLAESVALLTEPLWWGGPVEQLWIPVLGALVMAWSLRRIRRTARRQKTIRAVERPARRIEPGKLNRSGPRETYDGVVPDRRERRRRQTHEGFKRKGRRG